MPWCNYNLPVVHRPVPVCVCMYIFIIGEKQKLVGNNKNNNNNNNRNVYEAAAVNIMRCGFAYLGQNNVLFM